MVKRDPFHPVDPEALALARRLIDVTTFAALGVLDHGAPSVTRIAFTTTPNGAPLSQLSTQTAIPMVQINPALPGSGR